MIKFKSITMRNFLSIGAVTQAIDLDGCDLSLIIGENLDQGGNGHRNGCGKTSLLQALSYALFGESMNGIRKDNLINRTNGKNMLVTLDFSVNGVDYRIERGRKPNLLRVFVNNKETGSIEDDAQGENKETQKWIENLLHMTPDLFKIIVCLNTYNTPFLSMKAADQRTIIEELLGITLLSEKAETLKEQIKSSKDAFTHEELHIKNIEDSNARMQTQINSLKLRQTAWRSKIDDEISNLQTKISTLENVNIVAELQLHNEKKIWKNQKSLFDLREKTLKLSNDWKDTKSKDLNALTEFLSELQKIDIDVELKAHTNLKVYTDAVQKSKEIASALKQLKIDLSREEKEWAQLLTEIGSLEENKCFACNQKLHDDAHLEQLANKRKKIEIIGKNIERLHSEIATIEANPVFVPSKPQPHYATEADALRHELDVKNVIAKIAEVEATVDPYKSQLEELPAIDLPPEPKTHYADEAEAVEHQQKLSNYNQQLKTKLAEMDPYADQIAEMQRTGIVEVKYDTLNEIKSLWDHQKFLLDLLTNKDSFVRKRIIDQSLLFLNNRLTHYLQKLGLPHTVIFKNDLTVEITEWGRELDFGNLSRGESNRLIMGLSFAFRDVWQNLYHDINCLFIDEILDSGMDSQGFEAGIALLKEISRRFNRHVFLVSHREELIGRMPNVLKVYKTNGFTEYVSETSK